MNEKNNDTPETDAAEAPSKPTPPLPPPPGEEPPPPEPAPLPEYDPGPTPPKSPGLAAILSILVPGLGYLYSWAYERAFMVWAAIAVCVLLIIDGMWGFSFVIAFAYFFAIFDSYREAQFFNLRAENQEIPAGRPDSHGRLMFGVFLAVVAAVVLADKYDLFDMNWVLEWWPVPVFLLGVYFIGAAIWERMKGKQRPAADEGDEF